MDRDLLDQSLAFVDSWLGFRAGRVDVPGVAVAVAVDGELLLDRAWGVADAARQVPLTTEHTFRVASHSKTFTAAAVMQLAERDSLRLDDSAAEHLPWLREHPDARLAEVTVRQLLSHGAGVIRDGLDTDFWQLLRPFPDEETFRRDLLAARLVLDPNVALKYSNVGYTLLGLVVAAASGRPWADYVTTELIGPAGLTSTGPEPAPGMPGLVTGHGRADLDRVRPPIADVDTGIMAAATGVYSTASDLCRWMSALRVGSGLVMGDGAKRQMQQLQWQAVVPGPTGAVGYGLGLILERVGSRTTYGHSGGFPGHVTRTVADPGDGLVVSVLTNCIDGPATTIARAVVEVVDWFQSRAPHTTPPPGLAAVAGRYMNLWSVDEIVVTGERAVSASPDTWEPFAGADELTVVDGSTLRIAETAGSFGSPGELVHVERDGDRVRSLRLAGSTMWPEVDWLARVAAARP